MTTSLGSYKLTSILTGPSSEWLYLPSSKPRQLWRITRALPLGAVRPADSVHVASFQPARRGCRCTASPAARRGISTTNNNNNNNNPTTTTIAITTNET